MIEACTKPQLPPTCLPVVVPPAPVNNVPARTQSSSKRKLLVKIIVLSEAAVGTPQFSFLKADVS
jgi:hypothetical protein